MIIPSFQGEGIECPGKPAGNANVQATARVEFETGKQEFRLHADLDVEGLPVARSDAGCHAEKHVRFGQFLDPDLAWDVSCGGAVVRKDIDGGSGIWLSGRDGLQASQINVPTARDIDEEGMGGLAIALDAMPERVEYLVETERAHAIEPIVSDHEEHAREGERITHINIRPYRGYIADARLFDPADRTTPDRIRFGDGTFCSAHAKVPHVENGCVASGVPKVPAVSGFTAAQNGVFGQCRVGLNINDADRAGPAFDEFGFTILAAPECVATRPKVKKGQVLRIRIMISSLMRPEAAAWTVRN